MSRLVVDFAVLEEVEAEMRKVVSELDQLRVTLHDGVLPMIQQWSGAAAELFNRDYEEYQKASADINQGLADLHELVVTAHRNHSEAVRTSTRMWQV
jgi:WXG100 family type VII secretion target